MYHIQYDEEQKISKRESERERNTEMNFWKVNQKICRDT